MSGGERKSKIPEVPPPVPIPGNLLSSVAPPAELPNFITAPTPAVVPTATIPQDQLPPSLTAPVQPVILQPRDPQSQNDENFCPAIPLSKGEPRLPIRSPEDSQTTQSPESLPASTPEVDELGDVMPGSALFTWVKGAVSTGGILHRVAEKAKSSVDSMITTLDPQMKEYLRSGGDVFIVVASDKDVKISAVREAFQTVFGKATVVGYPAQSAVTAAQPVGAAAAYAAAKQRLAHVRSTRPDTSNNVPIVAIEGYIQETVSDRWFELNLLLLSQPSLGIELQMVSQGAPVPAAAAAAARAATPADYAHVQTGYSLTVGSIMADSLQVPASQWQEAVCGVPRSATLAVAAKALAGSYKRMLAVSAADL